MIGATWLVCFITGNIKDLALDRDVTEAAVDPYIHQISYVGARLVGHMHGTFALRQEFLGDGVAFGGIELHRSLGFELARHGEGSKEVYLAEVVEVVSGVQVGGDVAQERRGVSFHSVIGGPRLGYRTGDKAGSWIIFRLSPAWYLNSFAQ